MKENELEILTSYDQTVPYDSSTVELEVSQLIEKAIQDRNVYLVIDKIKTFLGGFRANGIGLAKLLYLTKANWGQLEVSDNYADFLFETTGLSRTTVDRYISVWEKYEDNIIPTQYQERFKLMPIKNQIPVAKALEQGYEISDTQWQNIVNAPDNNSLLAEMRIIKGVEPRKGSLVMILKRNGDITATYEGKQTFIGWLSTNEENDPVTERCIGRIVQGAGILRE
jgi:hypothetical protein